MSTKTFTEVSKKAPCPICGKPDYCCTVPSRDGMGIFFICKREKSGNNVGEYAFVCNTKQGNAMYQHYTQHEKSKEEWKKNHFSKPVSFKKNTVEEPKEMVLPNPKLNAIYRDFLSMLVLEAKDRKYLNEEGISDDMIEKYHIVSYPESDKYRFEHKGEYFSRNPWRKTIAAKLVEKYGTLDGVPGAYRKQDGTWSFSGKGGILFPLYDLYGNLYRLRIRLNDPYAPDGTFLGKYHNFSSSGKEGGTSANNNLGFFIQDVTNYDICFLTEGEKKGIIGNEKMKVPIITFPGVSSFAKILDATENGERYIDVLKRMGVRIIVIAFDADKSYNKNVLNCEQNAVQLLKNAGFMVMLANWDIEHGKGLDDLINNGYKPSFSLCK